MQPMDKLHHLLYKSYPASNASLQKVRVLKLWKLLEHCSFLEVEATFD
jgi:hypothetical protein